VVFAIATVSHWLKSAGPGAVFGVLLVESLGIPAPSEIVLLLAGLLVAEHQFSFGVVVLAGAAGSTLGAVVSYTVAFRAGRTWLDTHLWWLFRTPGALDRWQAQFLRYGPWIVLAGRVVSGVRMVVSYPAGLFRLPMPTFLAATAAGAVMWPLLAVGAGWWLGPRVLALLERLHSAEAGVATALVAGGVVVWAWRRFRRRPGWR
jgi:membrane protein DedA with SNARE-associated domain